MTGPKKPPVFHVSPCAEREPFAKDAPRGREVRELCDTFRLVRAGNVHMLRGSDVKELWERSKVVKAVRSAKVSGRLEILFWCN